MQLINATSLNRKSGEAQWKDLLCANRLRLARPLPDTYP
jgi:hypothetical protein